MPLPITRGAASARGFGLFSGDSGLFPFTTFTFIAPATGAVGPFLALFNPAYSGQPWFTTYFSVTNGVQFWTVPSTGTYRLTVAGADGSVGNGGSYNQSFSRGAIITMDIALNQGNVLRMIVGQVGLTRNVNPSYYEGPGGGASAVSVNGVLLVVAGGGGGQITSNNNNQTSSQASLINTPNSFTFVDGGIQTTLASGGNGGYASWAGSSSNLYTGGGGGWLSNGEIPNTSYSGVDMSQSYGRALAASSPIGGYTSTYGASDSNEGGFGGGSAPQGGYTGAGAGGGYNGGNAGSYYANSYGMGGSSYWISGFVSSALKPASNASNGYITVTKL